VLRDTVVHLLRDNFTEAKIRGKKRYLLERQQLQSLTEFKSQTEVIGFLADSPYGPELSKLPDAASPAEVERTIGESVASTIENLEGSAKEQKLKGPSVRALPVQSRISKGPQKGMFANS